MKKQCTLAFLSSQDTEYDLLKNTRASARNAKLKTVTVPTTRTETIALVTFMLFEKEAALLLGKTTWDVFFICPPFFFRISFAYPMKTLTLKRK